MISHTLAPVAAVITMDIIMDSAINFAHSQCDTHIISSRQHARAPLMFSGNAGKRQCSLCQSELGVFGMEAVRPFKTKEARRVESAGFLRGYSRGALGAIRD